jgi:hypothetical protein
MFKMVMTMVTEVSSIHRTSKSQYEQSPDPSLQKIAKVVDQPHVYTSSSPKLTEFCGHLPTSLVDDNIEVHIYKK